MHIRANLHFVAVSGTATLSSSQCTELANVMFCLESKRGEKRMGDDWEFGERKDLNATGFRGKLRGIDFNKGLNLITKRDIKLCLIKNEG